MSTMLLLVLGFAFPVLDAYIITRVWHWALALPFGVQQVSLGQAALLNLLGQAFFYRYREEKKRTVEEHLKRVVGVYSHALMLWFCAWLIATQMMGLQ